MELANFYRFFLGRNDVFSNFMLRQMLKIKQQDCQVIRFCKIK